jgi:hypothetical protein
MLPAVDTFAAGLDALRSAEHVRRRARAAMAMSVSERLLEAIALCRAGAAMLDALPADVQERARAFRAPADPGAEAALRRLLLGP